MPPRSRPRPGSTKVTLLSLEKDAFVIDEVTARRSTVISTVLDDIGSENPIPLLNVASYVLKKVIEYCEYHSSDPLPSADDEWAVTSSRANATQARLKMVIGEWDKAYIDVEQELLFEIIQAASYLDIKSLLDLGCKTVANMMTGKSVEDIRALFHIENDFTPEEELAMQVERSEIEMLYNMMGRALEEQPMRNGAESNAKMKKKAIAPPGMHF